MATNHEFEVVEKEVDFSEGPANPLKLFTVTGDVSAFIVPVIKTVLNTLDAIVAIGELGVNHWSFDSDYRDPEKRVYKAVSSDIYQTIRVIEGVNITSGVIKYYCIFAKLSSDGEVEEAE